MAGTVSPDPEVTDTGAPAPAAGEGSRVIEDKGTKPAEGPTSRTPNRDFNAVLTDLPPAVREIVEAREKEWTSRMEAEKARTDKDISARVGGALAAFPVEYREPSKFRQLLQEAEEGRKARTRPAPEVPATPKVDALDAAAKRFAARISGDDPTRAAANESFVKAFSEEVLPVLEARAAEKGKSASSESLAYDRLRSETDVVLAMPEYAQDADVQVRVVELTKLQAFAGEDVSPVRAVKQALAEKAKRGGSTSPAAAPGSPKEPIVTKVAAETGDFGDPGGVNGVAATPAATGKSFRDRILNSKGALELDRQRNIR